MCACIFDRCTPGFVSEEHSIGRNTTFVAQVCRVLVCFLVCINVSGSFHVFQTTSQGFVPDRCKEEHRDSDADTMLVFVIVLCHVHCVMCTRARAHTRMICCDWTTLQGLSHTQS